MRALPETFGTPYTVIGPDFISTIIAGPDDLISRTDPDLDFLLDKPIQWVARLCESKGWRLEK